MKPYIFDRDVVSRRVCDYLVYRDLDKFTHKLEVKAKDREDPLYFGFKVGGEYYTYYFELCGLF